MSISLLNVNLFQDPIGFICKILYWIVDKITWLLDWCQLLFRKLAGLDTYYYKGTKLEGDIVEMLLQTDLIRNMFISLLVLGIILLFIVTFIAVWKSEFNWGKEGNSKNAIWNTCFKCLANFIAVPVVCIFGVFMGNAVLRAIDGATSQNNGYSIAAMAKSAMCSNAVRADYLNNSINLQIVEENKKTKTETSELGEEITVKGIYTLFLNSNNEIDSDAILQAFENRLKVTDKSLRFFKPEDVDLNVSYMNYQLQNGTFQFSYDNDELMDVFFDYTKMNFVVTLIIMIFMVKIMLELTFNLVKRLFYVSILFVVSPPIIAITPVNEKAFGNWKGLFISNVTMGYVTIALYNIFMSIYPIFKNITLFTAGSIENFIVNLLFICVGLLTISELITALTKAIGMTGELSAPKEGWSKAFSFAGKNTGTAVRALGAPLTIAGKAVQYGNTAKYKGMGSMFKQMGGDIKSLAGKDPNLSAFTNEFKKEGGKVIAPFKYIKDSNKALGVGEIGKDVASAQKQEKGIFKTASKELGLKGRIGSKNANKNVQSILANEDYKTYKNAMGSLKNLENMDPTKMNSDQVKALKKARRDLNKLEKENKLETLKRQEEYVDSNSISSSLRGSNTALIKNKNKIKQSESSKNKAASANESLQKAAQYTAQKDALKGEEIDAIKIARQKAEEQARKINDMAQERRREAKENEARIAQQNKQTEELLAEQKKTNEYLKSLKDNDKK